MENTNLFNFENLAVQHGNAILEGDHKQANKIHKKLLSLVEEIKKQNEVKSLIGLTGNQNESVRLWASTYLLKDENEIATSVLKEITKSDSVFGLSAETTLDMWNKNMLSI